MRVNIQYLTSFVTMKKRASLLLYIWESCCVVTQLIITSSPIAIEQLLVHIMMQLHSKVYIVFMVIEPIVAQVCIHSNAFILSSVLNLFVSMIFYYQTLMNSIPYTHKWSDIDPTAVFLISSYSTPFPQSFLFGTVQFSLWARWHS